MFFLFDKQAVPSAEKGLWLALEEVAKVCPSCAEKMRQRRITKIRASVLSRPALMEQLLDVS